ncbi:hypothetical protein CSA37_12960 [Candidatus Fermentibacteria bacterium]|nr:MAG: hypothetical protein CSA37_12960 [Candidatus Fermentibacteria bacterium]
MLSELYYRFISLTTVLFSNPAAIENISKFIALFRVKASRRRFEIYREHLRRIFPNRTEKWYSDLLKSNWMVHERNLFAVFHSLRRKPGELLQLTEWGNGREELDRALNRGKGVLLLVPHFGDERNLHILMGIAGYDVHVMTSRYLDIPEYSRESRLRSGKQWNTLHFPDENPRWMYRVLQEGRILHYAPTAYGGPGGIWTQMFGVPVLVPSAPWKLQRRTGCAVFLAWCSHKPGMRYKISFCKLDLPEDQEGFTCAISHAIEELASMEPSQYEWKNLAIRHRETATIARLKYIPSDERILEKEAVLEDNNPLIIHRNPLHSEL